MVLSNVWKFSNVLFEKKNFLQMNCKIFWVCKMAHHVSFETIKTYLHKNIYPSAKLGDRGKKANFQKASKPYSILHGQLMHNNTRLVISSTERQHTIISDIHKGLGHDPKAKTMTSHYGRDSTVLKISNRFFWHKIKVEAEFIKPCDQRQKQGKIWKSIKWTSQYPH